LNFSKNIVFWVIIAFLLFALFNMFQSPQTQGTQTSLAYSEFLTAVDSEIGRAAGRETGE